MRDPEEVEPPIVQTGWCWHGFLDQHHPVRSSKEASQPFLSVASTPPRLRRGASLAPIPSATPPAEQITHLRCRRPHGTPRAPRRSPFNSSTPSTKIECHPTG